MKGSDPFILSVVVIAVVAGAVGLCTAEFGLLPALGIAVPLGLVGAVIARLIIRHR